MSRIFKILLTAAVLLAVIVLAGRHILGLPMFSKGMGGRFLNAVIVPGPGGECRLWILSDGSIRYISRVETPSKLSIQSKCLSCKTWLYVYDPVRKAVLARFKTSYGSNILGSRMVFAGGKVWVATEAQQGGEPRLFAYGAEPPALIAETPEIIGRYPALASGIIKFRFERDPDRFVLDTKDGRTGLVLSLDGEKLFASEAEFAKAAPAAAGRTTAFVLGREDAGPRRRLFKVTGPADKIKNGSLEFSLRDPRSLQTMLGVTAEPAPSGCVYIEGQVFYQDPDGCFILHQDAAGKVARRSLTRIGPDGAEKWSVGQDELFKEMKVDLDKNAFSNLFFMKTRLDVSRLGSVVMLQLSGVGIMGFDFATGKKLWEIRL